MVASVAVEARGWERNGGTAMESARETGDAGVKGVIFLRKRRLRLVSALLPCTFTR